MKNIRELKNLGISVFFEKENIDTANITDELMITIMGGLAQEESTSIGQNVAWGIRKKMRDGTMKYANAPYGYKKNHETGDIEINEETAAVVRKIFEMYLGGMGCRSIAEELNQRGVKPPAGQMWRQNRIGEMLSNPTYIGDSIWQKWYSAGVPAKRTKNTGERDMFYVEGDHDPIRVCCTPFQRLLICWKLVVVGKIDYHRFKRCILLFLVIWICMAGACSRRFFCSHILNSSTKCFTTLERLFGKGQAM